MMGEMCRFYYINSNRHLLGVTRGKRGPADTHEVLRALNYPSTVSSVRSPSKQPRNQRPRPTMIGGWCAKRSGARIVRRARIHRADRFCAYVISPKKPARHLNDSAHHHGRRRCRKAYFQQNLDVSSGLLLAFLIAHLSIDTAIDRFCLSKHLSGLSEPTTRSFSSSPPRVVHPETGLKVMNDPRGHGQSSERLHTGQKTVQDFVRFLLEVRRKLSTPRRYVIFFVIVPVLGAHAL